MMKVHPRTSGPRLSRRTSFSYIFLPLSPFVISRALWCTCVDKKWMLAGLQGMCSYPISRRNSLWRTGSSTRSFPCLPCISLQSLGLLLAPISPETWRWTIFFLVHPISSYPMNALKAKGNGNTTSMEMKMSVRCVQRLLFLAGPQLCYSSWDPGCNCWHFLQLHTSWFDQCCCRDESCFR